MRVCDNTADDFCDCPDGSDEPGEHGETLVWCTMRACSLPRSLKCCQSAHTEARARSHTHTHTQTHARAYPPPAPAPGTSACANGVFYCANHGQQPKLLASAFVDDGVCGEQLHREKQESRLQRRKLWDSQRPGWVARCRARDESYSAAAAVVL